MQKNKAINNFTYRIIETFGIQAIQLIISLILARLLMPENYGVVAIASTLVTILTSVVQSSFNAPLVQKKELSSTDLSSSFFVMISIAGVLYSTLFVLASTIARLYKMPDLVSVIRVLSLVLIIGAWNSIQMALIYRNLRFRASMIINLFGVIIQGSVGIVMAYLGFGVWSLVFSQITFQIIIGLLFGLHNKWLPSLVFSIQSIKDIWKIGFPLLGAELLTISSSNIYPIIIGLRYSKAELGLYQKGQTVPTTIVNGIVMACSTVFFSMMSRSQDDHGKLKQLLRDGVAISTYLIVPIAFGLFSVTADFVTIALGENWEETIPLMQIACMALSLYPLRIRLQALKAIGKAKESLIINAAYTITSLSLLIVFVFISLRAAIFSMLIAEVVFSISAGIYLKKFFCYSFTEQAKDIFPSYMLSILMAVVVINIGEMFMEITFISLIIKVLSGIIFYLLGSFLVKLPPFILLHNIKSNNL